MAISEHNYPEMLYSHDMENNCIILKWGESGYYLTDYPKGGYTDKVVDELNARAGITPFERMAMEMCSIASQENPNLDWKKHFDECLRILSKETTHNLTELANA